MGTAVWRQPTPQGVLGSPWLCSGDTSHVRQGRSPPVAVPVSSHLAWNGPEGPLGGPAPFCLPKASAAQQLRHRGPASRAQLVGGTPHPAPCPRAQATCSSAPLWVGPTKRDLYPPRGLGALEYWDQHMNTRTI